MEYRPSSLHATARSKERVLFTWPESPRQAAPYSRITPPSRPSELGPGNLRGYRTGCTLLNLPPGVQAVAVTAGAVSAFTNWTPSGLPRPVHGSHPGPAWYAPLLPLVMSWKAAVPARLL